MLDPLPLTAYPASLQARLDSYRANSHVILPDGTRLAAVDTGTAVRNRKAARLLGKTPTERNARTGELTPPGMYRSASSNSASDFLRSLMASK